MLFKGFFDKGPNSIALIYVPIRLIIERGIFIDLPVGSVLVDIPVWSVLMDFKARGVLMEGPARGVLIDLPVGACLPTTQIIPVFNLFK